MTDIPSLDQSFENMVRHARDVLTDDERNVCDQYIGVWYDQLEGTGYDHKAVWIGILMGFRIVGGSALLKGMSPDLVRYIMSDCSYVLARAAEQLEDGGMFRPAELITDADLEQFLKGIEGFDA